MPIKWITDREYILVGEDEEEESKNMSSMTASNGWSPRIDQIIQLDSDWGLGDLDGTLESVMGSLGTLKAIIDDYNEHLAEQKLLSSTPTTRSEMI